MLNFNGGDDDEDVVDVVISFVMVICGDTNTIQ